MAFPKTHLKNCLCASLGKIAQNESQPSFENTIVMEKDAQSKRSLNLTQFYDFRIDNYTGSVIG
jgi:hypothetical protein